MTWTGSLVVPPDIEVILNCNYHRRRMGDCRIKERKTFISSSLLYKTVPRINGPKQRLSVKRRYTLVV